MTTLRQSETRFKVPLLEIAAFTMIIAAVILFLSELSRFSLADRGLPFGLVVAGVPVGGQTPEQAKAQLEQIYGQPVMLRYALTCEAGQATPCEAESAAFGYPLSCPSDDPVNCAAVVSVEAIELGLRVNSDAMLSDAQGKSEGGSFWVRFWDYLWRRPTREIEVDLQLQYSEELLRARLEEIAGRFDSPPQRPRPVLNTLSFNPGTPGYTTDIEASIAAVDEALRAPLNRVAEIVVTADPAPEPDMQALQDLLVAYLMQPELAEILSRALISTDYDIVTSIVVVDLETGDEMNFNVNFGTGGPEFYDYEIAYAGTSVMKIPILVEMYRHISWTPSPDEEKIIEETMTLSGNFSANLMIAEIGNGSPTRGVQTITESMWYLGLENTFIATEYDQEDDPPYISTPARECARQGNCVNTRPDPYMQTTPRDIATLLTMAYQCAETGGGSLMIAYPGEFTQRECQDIVDVMGRNLEGELILAGVPEGTQVSHKHGWIDDTFYDSGIVRTPGGDYVLSMAMWADGGYLSPAQIGFPIMRDISVAVFNYFNPDLIDEPRQGSLFDE